LAGSQEEEYVRDFLKTYFEEGFTNSTLSYEKYKQGMAALADLDLAAFSAKLFSQATSETALPGGDVIRLVHLRELDGGEFPFLLALPGRRSMARKQRLNCFVGHRFLKEIEGPLRFNLAHVLNPHRIDLRWSAQDLSASDIFAEIVEGIRGADMCFFDNYRVDDKPNVYIEVGIAYALNVPTILTEYQGSSVGSATAPVPSDLQGLFRIRYSTYEELFRKLYFGLPNFVGRIKRN
jgi:hypothetical protein